MGQDQSHKEKLLIFQDVLKRMKEFTYPFLSQICGCFDEKSGELCGTGTFIRLRDSLYLLSAGHVAAEMFSEIRLGERKYSLGLCHSVGSDHPMAYIINPWAAWSSPHDIAVTRLDTTGRETIKINAVTPNQMAANTKDLNDDIYFIHGFPGKLSRFIPFYERGVASTSLPYGGWLCSSNWPGFDDKVHFVISYPADELIDEREMATTLPDPGGLSGSVVWKTNRVGNSSGWTPEMARIVGIAHRYDQESRCLVVTRIEFVSRLIMHLMRSEYAYFRWVEPGKPLWEDLDDWSAAENAIRNLSGSRPFSEQGGQN